MSMVQVALICTFVYWFLYVGEVVFLSWQCLTRPIVAAPLIGLLLGDLHTGIIMGASLEAIFMGISAIGGSIPADPLSASIIAVAYVITQGAGIEMGLAIAMPVGLIMTQVSGLFMPVWSGLASYWERLAVSCRPRMFMIQNLLFAVFVMMLPGVIMMFVGVAFGVDGLQAGLSALPAWFMTGLGVASSMMVAVGFAILCSMIWSPRLAVFYFLGFVLAKVLGMSSLAIAIIGAAIAITMFFGDRDLTDFKNSLSKKDTAAANGEEDFF